MNVQSYEIAQLLGELREIANKKSNGLNLDNDDAMTDEDYTRLTGITKDHFGIVHEIPLITTLYINKEYSYSAGNATCES